jgi:hypothetical protein
MSTTSKSPRKVALEALAVGQDSPPAYSHRCSPKVYTQPQLFACRVLKEFFGTDYRGITAMLADMSTLCEVLALPKVATHNILRDYLRTSHEPRCVRNGMDARKADDADPPAGRRGGLTPPWEVLR